MTEYARIELRADIAANWNAANPTLAAGEPAWETDTQKLKIGDGVTAWTALPYYSAADPEVIRDTMAAALVAGANITILPDDPGDTITITAAGGGGGGASIPKSIYTKAVAGATVQIGSTSVADLTVTGGGSVQVSIAAAAGDTIMVGYNGQLADANNGYLELGAGIYANGVFVRNVTPGANGTVPGWGFRNTEQYAHKAPTTPFVVQAGDIYAGTVTLRTRGKYAGAARSFFADADNPFKFYAYNLGA